RRRADRSVTGAGDHCNAQPLSPAADNTAQIHSHRKTRKNTGRVFCVLPCPTFCVLLCPSVFFRGPTFCVLLCSSVAVSSGAVFFCGFDQWLGSSSARIVASLRTESDFLAAAKIRSTTSSVAFSPRFSSQKITFERPDMGPTSTSCSR